MNRINDVLDHLAQWWLLYFIITWCVVGTLTMGGMGVIDTDYARPVR